MNTPVPINEQWDAYWASDAQGSRLIYSRLASLYRRVFICGRLAYWLGRYFPPKSRLLHAGCGGGEVDSWISSRYRITALDISPNALRLYSRHNPHAESTVHGDLLKLKPEREEAYDGAYNLGVLEHFSEQEIIQILKNMISVVRPNGRLVIFWPLAYAPSVKILGVWHHMLNYKKKGRIHLHPPEINLIRSRRQVDEIVRGAGLTLEKFNISILDLMIQAVLVVRRP